MAPREKTKRKVHYCVPPRKLAGRMSRKGSKAQCKWRINEKVCWITSTPQRSGNRLTFFCIILGKKGLFSALPWFALTAAPKRKDFVFILFLNQDIKDSSSETRGRMEAGAACAALLASARQNDENRKQARIPCLHRSRYPGHLDQFGFQNVLTSLIAFSRAASVNADKSLFFFFFLR